MFIIYFSVETSIMEILYIYNSLLITNFSDPDAPINLKFDNITSNNFLISWELPLCGSSPVDKYKLEVKYLGPVEDNTDHMCRPASIFVHRYFIFPPLLEFYFDAGWPLSKYEVGVTSINSVSESNTTSKEVSTLASGE